MRAKTLGYKKVRHTKDAEKGQQDGAEVGEGLALPCDGAVIAKEPAGLEKLKMATQLSGPFEDSVLTLGREHEEAGQTEPEGSR